MNLFRPQPYFILYLLLSLPLVKPAQAQLKFYEDTYKGGTTGGGYSTGFAAGGVGITINLHIAPGSTIRKAWLFAGRQGNAPATTVKLSSLNLSAVPLTFNAGNQVTPSFNSIYGGASAVHAIDITAIINPLDSQYIIDASAVTGVSSNKYADFYLFIAYENNALPYVTTAIYLNTFNFGPSLTYNMKVANPIESAASEVGIALFTSYLCEYAPATDGEIIVVNGTTLGTILGNELNSGSCGGPFGNYYYEYKKVFAKGDDNANQAMNLQDALSNAQALIPDKDSSIVMKFNHQSNSSDNAIWGVFISYGSGCESIKAEAGPDTAICIGDSVRLKATGGSTYEWTPSAGLSASNIASPWAKPQQTTTYVVKVLKGACYDLDSITVTVKQLPVPMYSYQTDSLTVHFHSTQDHGVYQWLWDFGDRSTPSTEQNPSHIYVQQDSFRVVLTVWNDCGVDSVVFWVLVDGGKKTGGNVGVGPSDPHKEWYQDAFVYPNPFDAQLYLSVMLKKETSLMIRYSDILGKEIYARETPLLAPGKNLIPLFHERDDFPTGALHIQVGHAKQWSNFKAIRVSK